MEVVVGAKTGNTQEGGAGENESGSQRRWGVKEVGERERERLLMRSGARDQ